MSDWHPNERQAVFLRSTAFEALYGGAAGGGKSDALLMDALYDIHHSHYRALLLRRTFPELSRSLIEKSHEYYPRAGGVYHKTDHLWRFPSGAIIEFGHCEHEDDVRKYMGAEYQFMGFDELTLFMQRQFVYLTSRLRSSKGLRSRVRAGSNPGNEGHEWVFKRWQPWLDPTAKVRAKPGETLYYLNTDAGEIWVPRDTPGALGRTFIPALVSDNPHVAGTGYEDQLRGLSLVEREQLLNGNWLIKPAAGLMFKRGWFEFVDAAPVSGVVRVRAWDKAATQKKVGNDPDWTAGVRMSKTPQGVMYIEHVHRVRGKPMEVEAAIKNTAQMDGHGCDIALSKDPGSAGVFEADYYVKALAPYSVHATRETGDKTTRAKPVSAQAEAGNIKLVKGTWNEAFIQELEAFPEVNHDDQVDATSLAFAHLHSNLNVHFIAAMNRVAAGGFR